MSDLNDQELINLLRKNDFKATLQRIAICKYILKSKDHPTAEKVYFEIKKEYKTISQATVYKTLALLKSLGLVTELSLYNSHSRFDPNQAIHINIICPNCNSIVDFESNSIDEFWQIIKSEIGNNIIGQRLDILKECDICLKKKQK
ncbi:MAG TPA: Fur family transcriptional regulator [Candidatus Bathyarchaeia archaeon]|nr:Fur family transcriptional regulator [Candidatus Bathyarchaeia archaeon]